MFAVAAIPASRPVPSVLAWRMFEVCGICGGDRFIANSFGNTTRCPACHGTGRKSDEGGLRDVTKTKPSHHQPKVTGPVVPPGPSTFEGRQLADEVAANASLSTDAKAKLTREILEYEGSHGKCTQTFTRKIRKQLRV
jgi:hypothetical protein